MATVIGLQDIKRLLRNIDVVSAMEEGFIQYSNGNTVVPPVGELLFDEPKGDTHIKYGYIKNDDYYVIKIASGFYDNPKLGISSSQGLMLLFDQKTGVPEAVLLDEGYLTDIRTAAAGALAAKYFAPKEIKAIGIIGTGIQARHQLQYVQQVKRCKTVWLWGRNAQNVSKFVDDLGTEFDIHIAQNLTEVAKNCNLIISTTPSETPLIKAEDVQPGTHITAVGSDTNTKQELESALLAKADRVLADSLPQSESRGEIYRAVEDGAIARDSIVELGTAIQNSELQRNSENEITIADLTGVAVQDIMIAQAVYRDYIKEK